MNYRNKRLQFNGNSSLEKAKEKMRGFENEPRYSMPDCIYENIKVYDDFNIKDTIEAMYLDLEDIGITI